MRTRAADPHLIQAIAAYGRGIERGFVFPWAPNGNLRQMWEASSGPPTKEVRRWAWDQILGLTGGLAKLHKTNTRHGDVKPENILRFNGPQDSPKLGPLVIADVGIAKYHAFETEVRKLYNKPTTNRSRTQRYAPPEIEIPERDEKGQLRVISRKYDSWSLGCVLLEFIVWLKRGNHGLVNLDKVRRAELRPNVDRYWEQYRNEAPVLHPAVELYIYELLEDGVLSAALQDLLTLVKKHLLKASLRKRSYIAEFLEDLLKTSENCVTDPSYLWDDAKETLTEHREATAEVVANNVFPISQQVSEKAVRPVLFF